MRLTVTPIGASGSSAASVARAVVDYLEGERGDPGAALMPTMGSAVGGGAVAYYADSIEGPGRWIGAGATHHGLVGTIERDSFQRVLEGRHPGTGERLITAQGSSGREHVAVGMSARTDPATGEMLYTVGDAARLLGLRHSDVVALTSPAVAESAVERLESQIVDGEILIPDREISRMLDISATPVSSDDILRGGDPTDWLTTQDAACILHVTPQYVRRLCNEFLSSDDHAPRATSLRCERSEIDGRGSYRIRRGDLAAFAAARVPPVVRVGYDVTLTVEKSIGVLTMLSTGPRQRDLVRALDVANRTAIDWLDRHASTGRSRGTTVQSQGLTVGSYFHATSRALDPHPHHHNVVANSVTGTDGVVRALDARGLYRHAPGAAALAAAALRWELRDLGFGWWERDDGIWEIAGVGERAISEFSRRRNEMDEVVTVLEERLGRRLTHTEETTVALSTRTGKHAVDPTSVLADWTRRAATVGLTPDGLDACFDRSDRADRAIVVPKLSERMVQRLFHDLAHPTLGLCANSIMFDHGDTMAAIANWATTDDTGNRRKVVLPPAEVDRLANSFCRSRRVVELNPARVGGVIRRLDGTVIADGQAVPRYTTVELLCVESRILSLHTTGLTANAGLVDPTVLDRVLADHPQLTGEQQQLVRTWCTSGHRVQPAVGRAGTGKTTTMRAAVAVWETGGYRVIGTAVKGEAARQLASDAGVDADTLALLLTRARLGERVLDARTVVIVDEASTVGDRDLVELIDRAVEAGAVIRLIGDPAQHGSVPAGGSFNVLCELPSAETPELRHVFRLRNADERLTAEMIRDGRIPQAIDRLVTSGQLQLTASDTHTYAEMLLRWYAHRTDGDPHPMVHGRNVPRRLLNQLAQSVLQDDGTVDRRGVTLADGRQLCIGDEVVARHGDRSIHPDGRPDAWMRNGTTGHIVGIEPGDTTRHDRLVVRGEAGDFTVDRSSFDRRRGGLDLGYAVTSYGVQGSTRRDSTAAITPTTSRAELYVDITRGQRSNRLIGTATGISGEAVEGHLPSISDKLVATIATSLARSNATTALNLDPVARQRAARSGPTRTSSGSIPRRR